MEKGDILLIKYRLCPVGWLIRKLTHCDYNHVAWVIEILNGYKCLIEATGKGIICSDLKKHSNELLYKTKVVKISNITYQQLRQSQNYAYSRLRRFGWFAWVKTLLIVLFGLKGKLSRPTCGGLIAESLGKAGIYFKRRKNLSLITPADIENSDIVEEVSI